MNTVQVNSVQQNVCKNTIYFLVIISNIYQKAKIKINLDYNDSSLLSTVENYSRQKIPILHLVQTSDQQKHIQVIS